MYHPGEVRGGILADAMGLGKTLSVISLIATDWSRRAKSSVGFVPTLLVVQPSLLQTWEKELRTHLRPQSLRFWKHHGPKRANDVAAMLAHDIVVTTYDVVAREWQGLDNGPKPLYSVNWHRIILDEGNSGSSTATTHSDLSDLAHEIRAGTTLRAKAIYGLRGNTRWAISGTPIQNRWEDLASLLKFIRVFPDSDLKSVRAKLTPGNDNSPIRSLLASICLRRSKNAIDLPNRTDRIHKLEFEDQEAIHYKSMSNSVSDFLHDDTGSNYIATYSNILTKINALRQICNLGLYYQAQLRTFPVPEVQGITMQGLFDEMLSAGVAKCFKCDLDLSVGEGSNEIISCGVGALELSQPHISTCGIIICASCLSYSHATLRLDQRGCQHQPPCKFFTVSLSHSALGLVSTSITRLPVKMRALQRDVQLLPQGDKWLVVLLCLQS